MYNPNPENINWRTHRGLAGDLQTMLIGEFNGINFSVLYTEKSLFNISRILAKRKITNAIMMLHSNHW